MNIQNLVCLIFIAIFSFGNATPLNQINELLIPEQGAWRGSTLPSGSVSNYTEHWGKELHIYRQFGNVLTEGEREFVKQGGILFYSMSVTKDWSLATGEDEETNEKIIDGALLVKSLEPARVMVSIRWEPCQSYKRSENNTPENYRKMWWNIQDVFEENGVSNVVWVVDFADHHCNEEDESHNCNALWPGDDRVDWLMFNSFPYGDSSVFFQTVGAQYKWFEDNSAGNHNYTSKPWGLGAFGAAHMQSNFAKKNYVKDVVKSIEDNTFPRFQSYIYFNSLASVIQPNEEKDYQKFVDSDIFSLNDNINDGQEEEVQNKLFLQKKGNQIFQ